MDSKDTMKKIHHTLKIKDNIAFKRHSPVYKFIDTYPISHLHTYSYALVVRCVIICAVRRFNYSKPATVVFQKEMKFQPLCDGYCKAQCLQQEHCAGFSWKVPWDRELKLFVVVFLLHIDYIKTSVLCSLLAENCECLDECKSAWPGQKAPAARVQSWAQLN